MRSYPAYWVLHDLLLEPLPQQVPWVVRSEWGWDNRQMLEAGQDHTSESDVHTASKERAWLASPSNASSSWSNKLPWPLGDFFFCKWLQKPAAQFEPADGNLPGPDYSTDSRIDSSTLILIQAGGHSHNISNCAHVCLFKSCRGML